MKKINLCILKQNKKNRFFTTKDKSKDNKKRIQQENENKNKARHKNKAQNKTKIKNAWYQQKIHENDYIDKWHTDRL